MTPALPSPFPSFLPSFHTLPPPSLPSHLSLPEVDDVILLAVHQVGVEDDVGVSTKELAVHLGVHWGQLEVLDPPDLQSARAVVHQVLGLTGALLVHLVHVKLRLNWRERRKGRGVGKGEGEGEGEGEGNKARRKRKKQVYIHNQPLSFLPPPPPLSLTLGHARGPPNRQLGALIFAHPLGEVLFEEWSLCPLLHGRDLGVVWVLLRPEEVLLARNYITK